MRQAGGYSNPMNGKRNVNGIFVCASTEKSVDNRIAVPLYLFVYKYIWKSDFVILMF